jgi:hypothetical protein
MNVYELVIQLEDALPYTDNLQVEVYSNTLGEARPIDGIEVDLSTSPAKILLRTF